MMFLWGDPWFTRLHKIDWLLDPCLIVKCGCWNRNSSNWEVLRSSKASLDIPQNIFHGFVGIVVGRATTVSASLFRVASQDMCYEERVETWKHSRVHSGKEVRCQIFPEIGKSEFV